MTAALPVFVIGLTGGLAMGKSTVAAMFAAEGAAVFDADRTVHALYSGPAVGAIERTFPGTVVDSVVDRPRLAAAVAGDPSALARLEAIVHPLVEAEEARFRADAARNNVRVIVLDIPLLFETGADRRVDATVVVTTSPAIQAERLEKRGGLSPAQRAALIARQMDDAERRARAHFIVDTSGPLEATRAEVADVLAALAATAGAR